MIFLALKTEDGRITGKIPFYCRMPGLSRQGFLLHGEQKRNGLMMVIVDMGSIGAALLMTIFHALAPTKT